MGEVGEDEWHELRRRVGEYEVGTGQEWAEVCFVPNVIGRSKNGPSIHSYQRASEESVTAGNGKSVGPAGPVTMSDGGWYKVTGVVTIESLEI